MALNNFAMQGRLTADPELRRTTDGTPVCSVTVAWSRKYSRSERKLFIDCVAWNGLAEFLAKNFRKGQELTLKGQLETRYWEDKQGQKRSNIECTLEEVHFCGPKQEQPMPVREDGEFHVVNDGDDDLPF